MVTKNVQIDEKLKRADEMLGRLSRAETELNSQKSQFENAITEASNKLSEHLTNLTNENSNKFSEIQIQTETNIATTKTAFDEAVKAVKTNCATEIEDAKNNASTQISAFEVKTKEEISGSQTKINTMLASLEQAQTDLGEIQNLLNEGKNAETGWNAQVKGIVDAVNALKTSSVADQKEVAKAKKEIVDGGDKKQSLLALARSAESEVAEFRDRIYGNENQEYKGSPSLEKDIDDSLLKMKNITDYTTTALKELTDESLDEAFSNISETAILRGTVALVLSVSILLVMAVLSWKAFQPDLKILDFVYRFSFLFPLGFAVFFLNRERKVQHVVEITYKYKSALAKALKGYRNLYNLQHSSKEYMELFDVLKFELLQNPMKDAKRYMDQDMFRLKVNAKEGTIEASPAPETEPLEHSEPAKAKPKPKTAPRT